ncbi:MAG: hypothetical protein K0A94_07870 [Desulfuromonadales bacterium]|nr:hypothetical protein [Desulfuromonadales bacterium]
MLYALQGGKLSSVACNAGTGLFFIQIEIAIGIEIVLAVAEDRLILLNLVAPANQTT